MEELKKGIISVLTNHASSSLDGLQMILDKPRELILQAVAEMIDEGTVKQGNQTWNGNGYIVYRKVAKKPIKLFPDDHDS